VYLATLWPLHSDLSYAAAAFRLYLNYDGSGGKFGDTAVSTTVSDTVNASAYASISGNSPAQLHVIVLNKASVTAPVTFHLSGGTSYTSARVFAFDSNSAAITERTAVSGIGGHQFTYTMPALTAAHFVLTAGAVAAPTILVPPAPASVGTGAKVVFSVVASDPASVTYQWQKNSAAIAGATDASLVLPSVSATDAAAYRAVVSNSGGSATSAAATLTVLPGAYVAPTSTLLNLSSRAQVGTGSNVMIAGFVVGGSGSKRVLIRAVGPTLTAVDPAGLPASVVLANPVLQLTTSGGVVLGGNDNWGNDAAIATAGTSVGAFPLTASSADAAMIVTLPPGGYTAIVTGANGATGVGMVEIYDLDAAAASRLINISTRAQVRTGVQALIAGFVAGGSGSRNVLVRAVGPTLTVIDPGGLPASIVLPDPRFDLKSLAGATVGSNDNWDSANGPAIAAAANAVGAFGLPTGGKDAALLATLTSGGYTPIVSDKTATPGLALVEVYEAP
jgi:hypothetical protein